MEYIKEDVLPEFFRCFWVRRIALDRRNYRQLVETTVEITTKVGLLEVVSRIVDDLKDESEPYRKMVMETIDKCVRNLGAADIGERLEEQLVDGMLYAFQEQSDDEGSPVMLNGFSTVINALGVRAKPYLPQVCGTIKWRLNNPRAKVRMQSADLISRIAVVMMTCGEEKLLSHLGVVLYEYLGEEYPDVLGSILGGLKAIVNVIGMGNMQVSVFCFVGFFAATDAEIAQRKNSGAPSPFPDSKTLRCFVAFTALYCLPPFAVRGRGWLLCGALPVRAALAVLELTRQHARFPPAPSSRHARPTRTAVHLGALAAPHTRAQEQTRKGAGELHRPRRPHR